MAMKKRQKAMTAEELQQQLDYLSGQVERINISFTFKGTTAQQSRTVRDLERLSDNARSYVLASALANLDYFGELAGVFVLREEALRRDAVPRGDL
jgi:hypothetical protein